MKKKFSIFLLAILIAPIFAIFGCDSPTFYNINLFKSGNGFVERPETSYAEGSTVSFVANGNLVAWVYQNSVLLSNDGTYSIKNTTTGNSVTKSELSFIANENTKGSYTAIFQDEKMPYAKLSSWTVTTDTENTSEQTIMTASLSIAQGQSNLSTIKSVSNFDVKDGTENALDSITGVMKLDPEEANQVVVDAKFQKENSSASFTFRTEVFLQNDTEETESRTYTHSVNYSDGIYNLIFKFNFSGTTYYLILQYKSLGK